MLGLLKLNSNKSEFTLLIFFNKVCIEFLKNSNSLEDFHLNIFLCRFLSSKFFSIFFDSSEIVYLLSLVKSN